jgi:hypothetical protein
MISLRNAVSAVLAAAVAAGAVTYFITSPPTEVDRQLPPSAPAVLGPNTATPPNIGQVPSAEARAAAAFQRAADAIIRRAKYAEASADEPAMTGHIPLPKKRPLSRP